MITIIIIIIIIIIFIDRLLHYKRFFIRKTCETGGYAVDFNRFGENNCTNKCTQLFPENV